MLNVMELLMVLPVVALKIRLPLMFAISVVHI